MKSRCKITVILFGLAFILSACQQRIEDENHHPYIRVINKFGNPIYVEKYSPVNNQDTLFRGSLGFGEMMLRQDYIYKVSPDAENIDALRRGSDYYEDAFGDKDRLPTDTLLVFVFDGKQLEANPSDMDGAVIQRYDLSFQDLKDVNWRLTYPPSPEMSGIKMYPPYKQTEQ